MCVSVCLSSTGLNNGDINYCSIINMYKLMKSLRIGRSWAPGLSANIYVVATKVHSAL